MTDHTKLKTLAQAAMQPGSISDMGRSQREALQAFAIEASPAVVLELIAQVDAEKLYSKQCGEAVQEIAAQRDELREKLAEGAQGYPHAWAIQGSSQMWRGEHAEIDAKAEAQRCGGTCVAYPLFKG